MYIIIERKFLKSELFFFLYSYPTFFLRLNNLIVKDDRKIYFAFNERLNKMQQIAVLAS